MALMTGHSRTQSCPSRRGTTNCLATDPAEECLTHPTQLLQVRHTHTYVPWKAAKRFPLGDVLTRREKERCMLGVGAGSAHQKECSGEPVELRGSNRPYPASTRLGHDGWVKTDIGQLSDTPRAQ